MAVSVTTLRKILAGENPMQALRAMAAPKSRPEPPSPQRALWVIDGDGLPERPWLVCGGTLIDCKTLGCKGLQARVCVARQAATDANRNQDRSKGQGSPYPLCDTLQCAQGRAIRDALDPTRGVRWKGAGPGARFERNRSDLAQQHAARTRLAAVGLLEETPSVDNEPQPVELEEDGEISAETAKARSGAPVREGADREPEGPSGVGARDARGVRAQVPGGAPQGRGPHGERGGREGSARGGGGDSGPGRGQAVLARTVEGRGDRRGRGATRPGA